jgi:transcriptional regulator with XRE-family HTH domain
MASIRELRLMVGLSQENLARRARTSRYRLSAAETGLGNLQLWEEKLLRDALADFSRERHAAFLGRLREAQ